MASQMTLQSLKEFLARARARWSFNGQANDVAEFNLVWEMGLKEFLARARARWSFNGHANDVAEFNLVWGMTQRRLSEFEARGKGQSERDGVSLIRQMTWQSLTLSGK